MVQFNLINELDSDILWSGKIVLLIIDDKIIVTIYNAR